MSNFLIAFGRRPQPGFLSTLVQLASNDGITITAAHLCDGPGCYNLALSIDADDADNFITQLTMVLQPAKWERCGAAPLLVAGQFTDAVNAPQQQAGAAP